MNRLPWVVRAVLRLLPNGFRASHEYEMRELLGESVRGRGPLVRLGIWTRACLDVLAVALRLRFPPRRRVSPLGRRRGREFVGSVVQDVRYACRSLRRDAGVALFATLAIGLGVGASVTVFSVANALLLRPLPFDDPDRLVFISNGEWGRGQQLSSISVQAMYVVNLRNHSRLIDDVAGFHLFDRPGDHTLIGDGDPERLTRLRVTDNFFPMLGITPQVGRHFTPEEASDDGPAAVMLTHGFWLRRFAGDPGVIGRRLDVQSGPATVVGVLPATFDFESIFWPGQSVDFVAPFPLSARTNRSGNTLALIGRLAPGATLAAAADEARAVTERGVDIPPTRMNGFEPHLRPLREQVSGAFSPALLVLTGAIGLVMLIVCANLTNLLLARGTGREKEITIRAALGANRGRIVRQLLTESLVLSAVGGGLGLGLAYGGTQILAGLDMQVPLLAGVRVDGAALAVTLAVALACGLGFGVWPALRSSGIALNESLKAAGRGSSTGKRHVWIHAALVVSEVALACVLLVGAGLLVRSFRTLLEVDPGYEPRRAIAVRVDPGTRFPTDAARVEFYEDVIRIARGAPGIEAVGVTDVLPMAFNRRWCLRGSDFGDEDRDRPCAFVRIVSDGYFDAMGLTFLAGRGFQRTDHAESRPVIVLNDVLADRLWPDESPLQRTVEMNGGTWEVIGLVQGTRHLALDQEPGPEFFLSHQQMRHRGAMHLIARGRGGEAALVTTVRSAVRSGYPVLPLVDARPVAEIVDRSVSAQRFVVWLLSGFASFALVLASLGIYGVISYSVLQRRRELGIRVAFGASAADIQRGILARTVGLSAMGMALGLVAAWFLVRILQGLLYGVSPADPVTFAAVPFTLLGVAALAGYVPARRAARADPMEVLNAEA